jgi:regulator of chromosome condensation
LWKDTAVRDRDNISPPRFRALSSFDDNHHLLPHPLYLTTIANLSSRVISDIQDAFKALLVRLFPPILNIARINTMPPKKVVVAAKAKPSTTESKVTKTKAPAKKMAEPTKPANPTRLTKPQQPAKPVIKPAAKSVPAKSTKRKADEEDDVDEPIAKKAKTVDKNPVARKVVAVKKTAAAPKKTKAQQKLKTKEKTPDEESVDVDESESEAEVSTSQSGSLTFTRTKCLCYQDIEPITKSAPKKAAAPKKIAVPKPTKVLPTINEAPTQVLDVFVFGEGSAGELGLGAFKGPDGKKVIDVTRPRLNPKLSAKDVGVVALAVGGMHCIALTKDNKILTWGVNDQGALGRETPQEGKMKDVGENKDSESDSDSDSDDGDSGLNPNESEPREVDTTNFAEGTQFASIFAGDSTSWAVTTTGLVYGWGTFRVGNLYLFFLPCLMIRRATTAFSVSAKISTRNDRPCSFQS